ncbi:M23 family metallopeptidase [Actinosynnema sp. NPDC059335]|uniref:M23 family metallopeptidase n=1 Tax=Actinosynnema sp. NPDC059335 TaxID=3346804 RepID=UPI00366D65BB
MTVRTRAAATIAALLSTTIAASPATAAPARADLTAAVADRLHDRVSDPTTADRATVVTPARQHGDWAIGTAVLTTRPGSPDFPDGRLFLARRTDGTWTVALEGEPRFAELAGQAPIVGDAERALLVQHDGRHDGQVSTTAGGDLRTGMALPFAVGQAWTMSGGPHGWSGAAAPWSSLDLAGGDQRVLAARAGTAYTMCTGWVRVIHDRGYATDYYHLWNNINVNGAAVGQGAFLGNTGTDVTCGGSASGRHVHFALRQNNAYVGIGDHNVGKWVPQNGASA